LGTLRPQSGAAVAAAAAALLAGSGAALLAWQLRACGKAAGGRRTRVVVLGLGYCGGAIARRFARNERCEVVGTTRGQAEPADTKAGVRTLILDGAERAVEQLAEALCQAQVIVATAPPGEEGDPFLKDEHLRSALEVAGRAGALVIYLSSVGVYGDQGGGRVTEETPPAPRTARAKRRLAAEEAWRALPLQHLAIARLPGIYGPFRGPLAKAREGNTRIVKEGHVFSRIHVDDVAKLCAVLLQRARTGELADLCTPGQACVINCCDSDPAPQHEVTALAYELLGRPVPPAVPFDSAELSAMQKSFYEESRYMVNDKFVGLVGALVYPSYQTGLRACQAGERAASARGGLSPLRLVAVTLARAKGALAELGSTAMRVALVDNGSLKPEATLSLRRIAAAVEAEGRARGRFLKVDAVAARFADRIPARDLEGRPAETLPGWLSRVAAAGRGQKVLLLPLLIGPSNTITKTMPGAARAVPSLEVEIAPPLVCLCPALLPPGASGAAEVAGMLADRIAAAGGPTARAVLEAAAAAAESTGGTDGEIHHVLLCDHGSPTPQVAAAREAVRAELQRRLRLAVTGCCMERREGPEYDFNGPLLEEALLALPQGARATVALLFLQEGRHAGPGGDIATIVAGVTEKRTDLMVTTTQVLAGHTALVDLLLQRLDKAIPLRLLP